MRVRGQSFRSACGGGVLRHLLVAVLLVAAGALLWREYEKKQRLEQAPRPVPEAESGDTTPVIRMTREDSATGTVVRILHSNAVPVVVTNLQPPVTPPTTHTPEIAIPPPTTNAVTPPAPTPGPNGYPRSVTNVPEAQIALDRLLLSPGCIDGVLGGQTRGALRVFQEQHGLPVTGDLDAATQQRLLLASPPLMDYFVAPEDIARLRPLSTSWVGKAAQVALEYETLLECLAERHHASQTFLRRLNPPLDWARAGQGTRVRVPDPGALANPGKASRLVIALGEKNLRAYDASGRLLALFPCSIARQMEKRPAGELRVITIAPNPNYTFDPNLFPESAEARRLSARLVLPPGPNNPVGVAWVGLDKPGYGIHGTPIPEQVGRTESHGCFRLTNWNAERLLQMVWVGLPVQVVP